MMENITKEEIKKQLIIELRKELHKSYYINNKCDLCGNQANLKYHTMSGSSRDRCYNSKTRQIY